MMTEESLPPSNPPDSAGDPPAPNSKQWSAVIPNWTPPSLNTILAKHWSIRTKIKRACEDMVAIYLRDVPKVTETYRPRRRLLITVRWTRKGKLPDPDNLNKILLDSVKKCARIVDDSGEFLDCPTPEVVRCEKGELPSTILVFTDLE